MTNNLLQAVWDGDLARVREMIAEEPEGVNWPTVNSKVTPLFYAVKNDTRNAAEVTRILLEAGAKVNYVSDVDERGLSPGARGAWEAGPGLARRARPEQRVEHCSFLRAEHTLRTHPQRPALHRTLVHPHPHHAAWAHSAFPVPPS